MQAFNDTGVLKGKHSLRLINWQDFLSKYIGRMESRHRPGKLHVNADVLSRYCREPPKGDLLQHIEKSPKTGMTEIHYVEAFPVQTRGATCVEELPSNQPEPSNKTENLI
jgi:hypothetical protein